MGFVELHFHLLPGVDDGPRTLDESVALASAAAADGTDVIVATPHIHAEHVTDPLRLVHHVAEVQDALDAEGVAVDVRAGGELSHPMVSVLSDAELDAVAHGPAGRRWVLLEGSFAGLDGSFCDAADELRARGFGIVMAHPERYEPTPRTLPAIVREHALGTVLQINAWSIAGEYGPEVRDRAAALLRLAPDSLIASDAHGTHRPPSLTRGLRALSELGEVNPRRRAEAIPRRLLAYGLVPARDRRAAA